MTNVKTYEEIMNALENHELVEEKEIIETLSKMSGLSEQKVKYLFNVTYEDAHSEGLLFVFYKLEKLINIVTTVNLI